jgi:methionine biosynthesis protein MetW
MKNKLQGFTNRLDIEIIYDLIPANSRVLDLGCGDGDLLFHLKKKNIRAQGIEKDEKCIYSCIEKGVIVHHGDLDEGLKHHLPKSFDFVILNQTIQETHHPGNIIRESLRIGKKIIIVFPNFAHWRNRVQILFKGETPVSDNLPFRWYNTPNLHFLSITDFKDFCKTHQLKITNNCFFSGKKIIKYRPNLFAKLALFVLEE